MRVKIIIQLVFLGFAAAAYKKNDKIIEAEIPPSWENFWDNEVECSKRNFTQIPSVLLQISDSLESVAVYISDNLITSIPNNLFTELFLQRNGTYGTLIPLCVTFLEMDNNKISEIEEGAFNLEPNCLSHLDLSKNELTTNAIKELRNIKELSSLILNSNNFPKIGKQIFENFTSLSELYLEYCKIETIEPYSFNGLENLDSIFLEGNLLTSFQPNTFAGLPNLEQLDISYMPTIYPIKDDFFVGILTDPEIIRYTAINITGQVYRNGIPVEPLVISAGFQFENWQENPMCSGRIASEGLLSSWKEQNYSLSTDNEKCELENYECNREIFCYGMKEFPQIIVHPEANKVEKPYPKYYIKFRGNAISHLKNIPKNLFLERLLQKSIEDFIPMRVYSLELSSNEINEIDELAFTGEPGVLSNIRLRFNNLTEISKGFHLLKSIKSLDLFGNNFTVIKSHSFGQMESLRSLDLSFCLIQTIEEFAFDGLKNLKTLRLSHNNLTSFHSQEYLGLSNNTEIFYRRI